MKLSDLVKTDLNNDVIIIQGKEIPIALTMETMEHIADIYGEDYSVFEKDLNSEFANKKAVFATRKNMKIMRSLVYGMVRSGGIECTPKELEGAIPFSELPALYQVCLNVFMEQSFQEADLKKSGQPQDHQRKQN